MKDSSDVGIVTVYLMEEGIAAACRVYTHERHRLVYVLTAESKPMQSYWDDLHLVMVF